MDMKWAWVGIFFVVLVGVIAYSKLKYKDDPAKPLPDGITITSPVGGVSGNIQEPKK